MSFNLTVWIWAAVLEDSSVPFEDEGHQRPSASYVLIRGKIQPEEEKGRIIDKQDVHLKFSMFLFFLTLKYISNYTGI